MAAVVGRAGVGRLGRRAVRRGRAGLRRAAAALRRLRRARAARVRARRGVVTEDAAGRLARAIAAAFADVPRPGDEHIGRWRAPEMEMVEELRARHWRDVPADVARYHFDGLRSLTPEAFHFYLPAFLIASLDDPDPEWSADPRARRVLRPTGRGRARRLGLVPPVGRRPHARPGRHDPGLSAARGRDPRVRGSSRHGRLLVAAARAGALLGAALTDSGTCALRHSATQAYRRPASRTCRCRGTGSARRRCAAHSPPSQRSAGRGSWAGRPGRRRKRPASPASGPRSRSGASSRRRRGASACPR